MQSHLISTGQQHSSKPHGQAELRNGREAKPKHMQPIHKLATYDHKLDTPSTRKHVPPGRTPEHLPRMLVIDSLPTFASCYEDGCISGRIQVLLMLQHRTSFMLDRLLPFQSIREPAVSLTSCLFMKRMTL